MLNIIVQDHYYINILYKLIIIVQKVVIKLIYFIIKFFADIILH